MCYSEGWGLPFVEAAAVGVPIVGMDWGGAADIFAVFQENSVKNNQNDANSETTIDFNNKFGFVAAPFTRTAVPLQSSEHRWASIVKSDFAYILKNLFAMGKRRARERGEEGAPKVREAFSMEKVARDMLEEIPMVCFVVVLVVV